jgi:hypothetical protein
MYGKVFTSIYDGSLYGQWEAIVTFQQMIVLADSEGYVDITPQAIAARTSIPLDIITKGLDLLSKPDLYSRSPDCDGRRIELVDDNRPWGWRIVNFVKYRDLSSAADKRAADRERIAAKRRAEKTALEANGGAGVAECRKESRPVANVAHEDTDTDTDTDEEETVVPPPDLDLTAWERWISYRKRIRKPIKPVSMLAAQRQLAGYGPDQAAVVEQAIAAGYQGLFPLKTNGQNHATSKHSSRKSAVEQVRDATGCDLRTIVGASPPRLVGTG